MRMNKCICPVCGKEAEHRVYNGPWGTEEEYINCSCGYGYEFAYGDYTEVIGNKEFLWSYKLYSDKNKRARHMKKTKKAIIIARRNWKKKRGNSKKITSTERF